MGNIGDAFATTLPTVGSAGPGYATSINAILTEAMARLSAQIPYSSLLNNTDLDMNAQAVLDAAYVTLVNESVSPVSSPSNRLTSYGGNLWWVSPSGALQLTVGAALNSAAIAGIGGDYGGANPASVRFINADTRYDFYDDYAGGIWGYVRARGFDIAASATAPVVRARLLYAGAASMDYTMPAATPASQTLMQMSAAGVMLVDNTLAANQSITIPAGTGRFKHPAKSRYLVPQERLFSGGAISSVVGTVGVTLPVSGTIYYMFDGLTSFERLTGLSVDGGAASTNTVIYTLYSTTLGSGALVAVPGATQSTTGDAGLVPTTPTAIDGVYVLKMETGPDPGDAKNIIHFTLHYDGV